MKNKKLTLEICIPTYNRVKQLSHCLESIYQSLANLAIDKRTLIGIRIHNNSVYGLSDYEELINSFRNKFEEVGLGKFHYSISGIDIGAPSNNYGVLVSANSDYVWYLPDDDLSRFDSIQTILNTIQEFGPALIVGGYEHNIGIDYSIERCDDKRIPFLVEPNSIHHVAAEEKVNIFFKTNPVAAQNLVFKLPVLKKFLFNTNLSGLINPFLPTFLSLICLKDDAPAIFLRFSIGLFRFNEPHSDWRHEWTSYALQIWPRSISRWVELGLLEEINPANRYYVRTLDYFRCRLYLLIWGTYKTKINIFTIVKYYPKDFIEMIALSPLHCTRKLLYKVIKPIKSYLLKFIN